MDPDLQNVPADDRSELEEHLAQLRSEGQISSRGAFTVDWEAARRKLSKAQLPTPEAWTLKVVQAVVSSGSQLPVRFLRQEGSWEVFFQPGRGWHLEDVESRFLNPAVTGSPHLDHLSVALRSLAGQGRAFELRGALVMGHLVWTGQELCRRTVDEASSASWSLLVSDARDESSLEEVAAFLREHAFACPLPLLVDNERIDALQRSPRNGYSASSFPIRIGWVKTPSPGWLPSLTLPSGAPEALPASAIKASHRSGYVSSHQMPETSQVGRDSCLAFLIAYHASIELAKLQFRRLPKEVSSTLTWVLDGVIVAVEPLGLQPGPVAIELFLSAHGLGTDLTTLALLETPERRQRASRALEAFLPHLKELALTGGHFKADRSQSRLRTFWKVGGMALGVGGATAVVTMNPLIAIFCGAGMAGCVERLRKPAAASPQECEEVDGALRELAREWERILPDNFRSA